MAMLPQDHEQLRPPYRKPVVSPRHGINAPGYQAIVDEHQQQGTGSRRSMRLSRKVSIFASRT